MSKYFSQKFKALIPYTPGEQPKDQKYVKLNTNESPYPPSEGVIKAINDEADTLRLYSDPECYELRCALADFYKVKYDEVIVTNGSDEILNFAFMAYQDKGIAFPDITYGFYTVACDANNVPYTEIPLKEDFSIDKEDYVNIGKTIVIANPNAPTGREMALEDIEYILKNNPDNVVIVDEAYVDFGGTSAIQLINKYPNLLVCGTYSKSRSMAGARLGFGIGNSEIIKDIDTLRCSINPYNINRLTLKAGAAAIYDHEYYEDKCKEIIKTREYTVNELENLGFSIIPSKANFVFAKSDKIDGKELYLKLKENGVLIRHFTKERICQYNRITIGTKEEMDILLSKIKEILL